MEGSAPSMLPYILSWLTFRRGHKQVRQLFEEIPAVESQVPPARVETVALIVVASEVDGKHVV